MKWGSAVFGERHERIASALAKTYSDPVSPLDPTPLRGNLFLGSTAVGTASSRIIPPSPGRLARLESSGMCHMDSQVESYYLSVFEWTSNLPLLGVAPPAYSCEGEGKFVAYLGT